MSSRFVLVSVLLVSASCVMDEELLEEDVGEARSPLTSAAAGLTATSSALADGDVQTTLRTSGGAWRVSMRYDLATRATAYTTSTGASGTIHDPVTPTHDEANVLAFGLWGAAIETREPTWTGGGGGAGGGPREYGTYCTGVPGDLCLLNGKSIANACRVHDACYAEGMATQDPAKRKQCDDAFRINVEKESGSATCARIYHRMVVWFGGLFYYTNLAPSPGMDAFFSTAASCIWAGDPVLCAATGGVYY